jgi:glutamate synthase domain-containing protein 3
MQHEFGSGSQEGKAFVDKVAEKLGVPPAKVAAAFQEARKERIEGWVTQRIQQAVQDAVITKAEADKILDWWRDCPDAVRKLWPGHMHGGHSGRCGREGLRK